MDKGQIFWNITANTSVILTDLFRNETELYHDHTLLWGTIGITDKIQPPYGNKWYVNADTDDQVYWEITLKPPQVVIPKENGWSGEALELTNHQLISMLNSSAQGYYKVQTT